MLPKRGNHIPFLKQLRGGKGQQVFACIHALFMGRINPALSQWMLSK